MTEIQKHYFSLLWKRLCGLLGGLAGLDATELGLTVGLDGQLRPADGRDAGDGSGAQVGAVAGLGGQGSDRAVGLSGRLAGTLGGGDGAGGGLVAASLGLGDDLDTTLSIGDDTDSLVC